MRTGKSVIVLVANANRSIKPFGQVPGRGDPAFRQHDAGTVEYDGEPGRRQESGSVCHGVFSSRRALEFNRFGQINVDNLGPHVPGDVHLGRCRGTFRLCNDPGKNLCHAGRVTHLLLVSHHVLEEFHLLDFLESALANGLVCRLRRDQKKRRVIPVGRLHGGHEIGNPRPVLRDHHRHLAGRTRVAVCHHAARPFVRAVPKRDASLGKEIRNRHEGRSDDAEGVAYAMPLEDFDENFFGGHLHCVFLPFGHVSSAMSAAASAGSDRRAGIRQRLGQIRPQCHGNSRIPDAMQATESIVLVAEHGLRTTSPSTGYSRAGHLPSHAETSFATRMGSLPPELSHGNESVQCASEG